MIGKRHEMNGLSNHPLFGYNVPARDISQFASN